MLKNVVGLVCSLICLIFGAGLVIVDPEKICPGFILTDQTALFALNVLLTISGFFIAGVSTLCAAAFLVAMTPIDLRDKDAK